MGRKQVALPAMFCFLVSTGGMTAFQLMRVKLRCSVDARYSLVGHWCVVRASSQYEI